MSRRMIHNNQSVAPVTRRSIKEHLLDAAAVTFRRHCGKTNLENQPDPGHSKAFAAPISGSLVRYQIAVRVEVEIASGEFQPEAHQKASGLESILRLPERTSKHADARHQTKLPAVNLFQHWPGHFKLQQPRKTGGQPERQRRTVHAAIIEAVACLPGSAVGKAKPFDDLIVVGRCVEILKKRIYIFFE